MIEKIILITLLLIIIVLIILLANHLLINLNNNNNNVYTLPKNIFTYWDKDEIDPIVKYLFDENF